MSDTRPLDDSVDALVRRAQAGEEAARDELIRRCYDRVYRWALMRTGDRDDADDVTQTVLVRLYTHLDRYSGRSRFTTWLFRVTQNAANALHRRSGARRRLADSLERELTREPAGGDPIEKMHAASLGDTVRAFFSELSATLLIRRTERPLHTSVTLRAGQTAVLGNARLNPEGDSDTGGETGAGTELTGKGNGEEGRVSGGLRKTAAGVRHTHPP